MSLPQINTEQYDYLLPDTFIASRPVEPRDNSRLLISQNNEAFTHDYFFNIEKYLPEKSLLILNNTKVIPARLLFTKETGAGIEVFLLKLTSHQGRLELLSHECTSCIWQCTIGNLKKWKNDIELHYQHDRFTLSARLIDRENMLVELRWSNSLHFYDMLETIGHIPLPPYIHRPDDSIDKERYQTLFANVNGAVAAPTASLHFSNELLSSLQSKHKFGEVTLHVSSGTFQPLKDKNALNHNMHQETIIVYRDIVEKLLNNNGSVVAVGTTALRTIESAIWYGYDLIENKNAPFFVEKLAPYKNTIKGNVKEALQALLEKMDISRTDSLQGSTEIMIVPGYKFQLVDMLITNFHQPKSTLLLLIAAFIGDEWENVYKSAKENKYRFLSYGDACLLYRNDKVLGF